MVQLKTDDNEIYEVPNELIQLSKIWSTSIERWYKDKPILGLISSEQLLVIIDFINNEDSLGKLQLAKLIDLLQLSEKLIIPKLMSELVKNIISKLPTDIKNDIENNIVGRPPDKYGIFVYNFVDKMIVYLAHSINSIDYWDRRDFESIITGIYSYPNIHNMKDFRQFLIDKVNIIIDKVINKEYLESFHEMDEYLEFTDLLFNNKKIDSYNIIYILKEMFPNLIQTLYENRNEAHEKSDNFWFPGGMDFSILTDLVYILKYKYSIKNNLKIPEYNNNPFGNLSEHEIEIMKNNKDIGGIIPP